MSSTRKVLRIFLASPGDLQEERRAIRSVVNEFNDSWADALGYQIELMGWEDTVASYGRPQHIINQEVDRCDLFIGMIWRRWGTPPSHDGKFTSGFQEEFERAIERREGSGSLEISLYLRKLSRDDMEDPGEGLKKVMEFREKITADKKILYQEFSAPQDMEKLGRKCITAYVQKVSEADEFSEPSEARVKRTETGSEKTEAEKRSPESSPLLAEGFTFLKNLVDRIGQEEAMKGISASDVARFRLLANSISKPGNEKMNLGVHDLNILFSARTAGMKLGERETRCLATFGFQHLNNEVVPLWCWYSDLLDSGIDAALVSSYFGANDDEMIGAIRVLGALAHQLPTGDNIRREFVNRWFSERRIKAILNKYISSDKSRYYNVIHWLDLGASMPRNEARKIARAATG